MLTFGGGNCLSAQRRWCVHVGSAVGKGKHEQARGRSTDRIKEEEGEGTSPSRNFSAGNRDVVYKLRMWSTHQKARWCWCWVLDWLESISKVSRQMCRSQRPEHWMTDVWVLAGWTDSLSYRSLMSLRVRSVRT